MNARRTARLLLLAVIAASLGACHFHGGCCHSWGYYACAPVRHCR